MDSIQGTGLTLERLKRQVSADEYFADDALLRDLGEAAVATICNYTGRTAAELLEIGGGGSWPAPLLHAAAMLAAHWHNQREAADTSPSNVVALGFEFLCLKYRRLGGAAPR